MNIEDYRTDLAAEKEGKWFEYDGSRFRIAASMNPAHRKLIQKLGKTKYAAAVRRGDTNGLQAMSNEAMAEAILLEWEDVRNGDREYPYSRENALTLLNASRVFRDWVEATAMDLSQFVINTEAAAAGELKSRDTLAPDVGT